MAAPAPTADLGPPGRHEPLFDVHPGPGPASKCSTPTARWRRSAGVVLAGTLQPGVEITQGAATARRRGGT
jgi:hypothetical protein